MGHLVGSEDSLDRTERQLAFEEAGVEFPERPLSDGKENDDNVLPLSYCSGKSS